MYVYIYIARYTVSNYQPSLLLASAPAASPATIKGMTSTSRVEKQTLLIQLRGDEKKIHLHACARTHIGTHSTIRRHSGSLSVRQVTKTFPYCFRYRGYRPIAKLEHCSFAGARETMLWGIFFIDIIISDIHFPNFLVLLLVALHCL